MTDNKHTDFLPLEINQLQCYETIYASDIKYYAFLTCVTVRSAGIQKEVNITQCSLSI